MNIKKNLKNATSSGNLFDAVLGAVAGTLIYTVLPTALKLKGPAGITVGTFGTWIVGAITGQRGIQVAAAVLPATHLMYVYGNSTVVEIFKRPIWQLSGQAVTEENSMNGYADIVDVGGQPVYAMGPTDLPSQALPPAGMNGYVYPEGMAGYAAEGAALPSVQLGHSRGAGLFN